ncbi:MAG: hypothetical protein ACOY58_00430 [Candidatus Micrarchaeota archaeon]
MIREEPEKYWPEEDNEENDYCDDDGEAECDYELQEIGARTAADVRDDENAIRFLAKSLGLTERTVRNRLKRAYGNKHVRTIFKKIGRMKITS